VSERKHLARVCVVLALCLGTLWAGARPASAAETCNGLTATIVGDPATPTYGTEGDDVIVSNGSKFVSSHGGNDTICTTNSRQPSANGSEAHAVLVDAGAGTDFVDRRADVDPDLRAVVYRPEVFLGAPGSDYVEPPVGTYDIRTGEGSDTVLAFGVQDSGSVDLGEGDDSFVSTLDNRAGDIQPFRSSSLAQPPLQLSGGPGLDRLSVDLKSGGVWHVDAALGRMEYRTKAATTRPFEFEGIEKYQLENLGLRPTPQLEFVGSNRSEDLVTVAAVVRTVEMKGGDDTTRIRAATGSRGLTRVDGGAGEDGLAVERPPDGFVMVDLALGLLRVGSKTGRERGFENALAVGGKAHVLGDERDNELGWLGCEGGGVLGRGGNDHIAYSLPVSSLGYTTNPCREERPLRAFGGPGRDVFLGGPLGDLLVGGLGFDKARGEGGRDTCRAELRRSCERR
jgi:Ca2+-binding RTX toxin-like protein